MKEIKTYRCEVDLYRNGSIFRGHNERLYDRGSTGIYYVGAKSAKEAKKLLQQYIHFGSITIPNCQYIPDKYRTLNYKEIKKFESPYTIDDI